MPTVRDKSLILLLLVSLHSNTSTCLLIEENFVKLEKMIDGVQLRRSRDSEEASLVWQEFEFGTGAGNRDELLVSGISIEANPELPVNATDWQFIQANGHGYLAHPQKSGLSIYKLDRDRSLIEGPIELNIDESLSSFKLIALRNSSYVDHVAILACLRSSQGASLRWYRLLGDSLEMFWSRPLEKPARQIELVEIGDQKKLLLLDETEIQSGTRSLIHVCGFSVDPSNVDLNTWLCQRMPVPRVTRIEVCPPFDPVSLVLQGSDDLLLYRYKDPLGIEEPFVLYQTISAKNARNFVCFESGSLLYLATSGPEPGLYHLVKSEFKYNKLSDLSLAGEISSIKDLPLNTYRDESLLLAQLVNGTVVALAWQGTGFKRIELPNDNLDRLDLSRATVLPKFGLVAENRLVKIEARLVEGRSLVHEKTEGMLKTKTLLDAVISQQESVINETERRIEKSYLTDPLVTGFWNFTAVNVTAALVKNATTVVDSNYKPDGSLSEEKLLKLYTSLQQELSRIENSLEQIANHPRTFDPIDEIDLSGNIDVKGLLTVKNFTASLINNKTTETILDFFGNESAKFLENDSIGNGNKKISINGIPIGDILFDPIRKNYSMDLSRVNRLEIDGNLNVSMINGIDWDSFINNVVWKNQPVNINESILVDGTITADEAVVDYLNDVQFPAGYVNTSNKRVANVTGVKSFEKLTVARLIGVKTINEIEIDEFLIANRNNTLAHGITFEDLTVDRTLQVDGDLTGVEKIHLLNETSSVRSNVAFVNLTVLGDIILEDSIDQRNWSHFRDFLLRTDKNATITGEKIFLGNVEIVSNVTIQSGLINGHPIDEFVTVDTDQDLTNLSRISGNVSFEEIRTTALDQLNELFSENSTECLRKIIVFESPIILDRLSFETLGTIVSSELFLNRLNQTFDHLTLNDLNVLNLIADEILPESINGISLSNMSDRFEEDSEKDCQIDRMETESLNASFINGLSRDDWTKLNRFVHEFYHDVFEGQVALDSVKVTGDIDPRSVNGRVLEELYEEERMGTVHFEEDLSVENLNVLGLINRFNFTEFLDDTVLRTERNVLLSSIKAFGNVNCRQLNVYSVNGLPIESILDTAREQNLTGPVVVNGSVNVLQKIGVTGLINNVPFDELNVNEDEFHENPRFTGDVSIENLFINGSIQGLIFEDFLKRVVFKNEDDLVISGGKTFETPVKFEKRLTITDRLNDLNLKNFFENVLLVDQPFSIDSKIIFNNGISLEKDLLVENNFESKRIMAVDMEEMAASVAYLNKPTFIKESLTFEDANFRSGMRVERINAIETSLLIPLHTEQSIMTEIVRARNITADTIEIYGSVNDHDLKRIYENTFMLLGDQNVTGRINFRGNVHARQNFDARTLNGIDPGQIVQLNTDDDMIGNFVFKKEITLNGSLRILGLLNDVDVDRWQAIAVRRNFPRTQTVSGKWTIRGNVRFKEGTLIADSLGGVNMSMVEAVQRQDRLGLDTVINEEEENVRQMCESLNALMIQSENQIYRFAVFDHLEILEFDTDIASVHYFELDDMDYLLISYDTCQMIAFVYNGRNFEQVANVSDFGVVKLWTTFSYKNALYFLTLGENSCGRSPGNIWKLENYEFLHVLDLGNVTDSKQISQDMFVTLMQRKLHVRSIRSIVENSEEPLISTIVEEEDLKSVPGGDRIVFVNRHSIYEYNSSSESVKRSENQFGSTALLHLKAGIFRREFFLYYDEDVSDNIFIGNEDLTRKEIEQTIKADKPGSFCVLNFDDYIETLLIFVENKRNIRIYEYSGLDGFVYRDSVRMDAEKLFAFKIRKYPRLAKRNCLAVINKNRLTILEARMYGERSDLPALTCPAV